MSDYESKLISCTFRKMTTDICRSYNHLAKKNALFEFKNPYVLYGQIAYYNKNKTRYVLTNYTPGVI